MSDQSTTMWVWCDIGPLKNAWHNLGGIVHGDHLLSLSHSPGTYSRMDPIVLRQLTPGKVSATWAHQVLTGNSIHDHEMTVKKFRDLMASIQLEALLPEEWVELEPDGKFACGVPVPQGGHLAREPLPDLVPDDDEAWKALPGASIEDLNPPGMLREFVYACCNSAHRPQPELALGAAIAWQGYLMGPKFRDITRAAGNVYVLGVAASGAGKQAPIDTLRASLAGEPVLDEVTSGAAVISALKRRSHRILVGDEMGLVLGSTRVEGGHMTGFKRTALSLSGFKGRDYRKGFAKEKEEDAELVITAPHLVILGMSTPSTLVSGLDGGDVTEGLLGRCLVFRGQDDVEPVECRTEMTTARLTQHALRWRQMINRDDGQDTWIVPYTKGAKDAVKEIMERQYEIERGRVDGDVVRALSIRYTEKVKQLALISCAACDRQRDAVIEDDVRWADMINKRCQANIMAIAGEVGSTEEERDCQAIIDTLVRNGGQASGSKICRAKPVRRIKNTRQRDSAFAALEERGDIIILSRYGSGRRQVNYRLGRRYMHLVQKRQLGGNQW